jgi:hypothetical protein
MTQTQLIDTCPITNSDDKIVYLDLGNMPLVNNLCSSKNDSLNCERFPLSVQLFTKSMLSTLTLSVDPNILYKHYLYTSNTSKPYFEHCIEMFDFVNHYLDLSSRDNILDIGGNDGTLLKAFLSQNKELNVLNVDASENLVCEANNNGIPSINAFWNIEFAKTLNKKFKLITTTNCFQHTYWIKDFVEAISVSLDDYGIWCLEFPYWKTSIETNQFDQIYHEHLYYYTISPIQQLLKEFDLRIIKITHHPIHGGSVRLLISRCGELGKAWQPCNYSVKQRLNIDSEWSSIDKYISWGQNIKNILSKSHDFIFDLKNKGASIAGFGAAAKGCTFLNAINIDNKIIDYIIDDTTIKQNKFMPGTGIEILPRSILEKTHPDFILILAHNFSDFIIKSLKSYGYKNKFLILLPEPKILS